MESPVDIFAALLSERGRRPVDEDAALVSSEYGVFAVSDGMGGLDAGELAIVRATARPATARIASAARVLVLHRDGINSLLQRRPRLGASVMMELCRTLADRLVEMTEQVATARTVPRG